MIIVSNKYLFYNKILFIMKIKCVLVISSLILFILTTNISFSQDTTFILFPKENALKKGNYALVFELGTIFGYSSFFEAYTLTVKKHLSENLATRLSLGFNYSEKSGIMQETNYQGEVSNLEYNNPNYSFQISINLQCFLTVRPLVKPFVSFGPYAEYYYRESSNISVNISDKEKMESWGLGLFGSFGLEVFAFKNISFIGEYILKATLGKSIDKRTIKDLNNGNAEESYNHSTDFNFKINTARMGFSVYF
jgi:hypothetical protein